MAESVSQCVSAAVGFAVAIFVALSAAAAEDYPVRPVRIVVGFGPGASGDIAARVLAQKLGALLGQQFVVENRTGAGSNIATNFVAHAANDGYTLLQGTVANTVNPAITPNLAYDFVKDFVPISLFTTLPNILVVHPAVEARSVAELIELARSRPGELSFGSAGVGSGSHFTGELFNVMAGVKLLHIPYPGTAQAATDLLGRACAGDVLAGVDGAAVRRRGQARGARHNRVASRQRGAKLADDSASCTSRI
jgi:tripartite-type tricarboxylate transporter receptor subunit TctC